MEPWYLLAMRVELAGLTLLSSLSYVCFSRPSSWCLARPFWSSCHSNIYVCVNVLSVNEVFGCLAKTVLSYFVKSMKALYAFPETGFPFLSECVFMFEFREQPSSLILGLKALLSMVSWWELCLTKLCQADDVGEPLTFSFHSIMYVISNRKREKCVPILQNGHKLNCGAELFRKCMALMVLFVDNLDIRHFENQEGHIQCNDNQCSTQKEIGRAHV